MRVIFGLIALPVLMWSALIQSTMHIQVDGNAVAGLKIVQHAVGDLGYKMEIEKFTKNAEGFSAKCNVIGHKPFNADIFLQNLAAQQVKIKSSKKTSSGVEIALGISQTPWLATPLGADEGSELQKSSSAQWFTVEPAQKISIQPPFGVKWYPDIAVFDENFVLLFERRDTKSSDEIEFLLPEGAKYLKVSNMEGMKLLKEGTWVESASLGR